jgi:DNA gyrase subunit A
MIAFERPDLSEVDPIVIAYIEALEAELLTLSSASTEKDSAETPALEPSEPPTTLNVITISADNHAKRTPRHHYLRQRRGGMGVFDIDTDEDQPPAILTIADASDTLILITDQGRAFRFPVANIPETDVRGRGISLSAPLNFLVDERIIAALPENGGTYVLLVSQRGWVRRVQRGYLGPRMLQGQRFHKLSEGGYLTHAAWSDGEADVFVVSRNGLGIRFSENQIPGRGCLGMRISPDDQAIAITATSEDGGVFLQEAYGKGTIRLMEGFRKNKTPGAGGKVAIKCDQLIGATRVEPGDDLFIISRLSKIIRFSADEIPAKTGVVQGVSCIGLRGDEASALVACTIVNITEPEL